MKKCTKCNVLRPRVNFHKCASKEDGLNPWCKPCKRHYTQVNSVAKRPSKNKQTQRRRKINRELIVAYLTDNPCVDCGESDIVVLEFDHVRGVKFLDVASMVSGGYAISSITREMEKCDVRCCNCHRRKTSRELGHYRTKVCQGK